LNSVSFIRFYSTFPTGKLKTTHKSLALAILWLFTRALLFLLFMTKLVKWNYQPGFGLLAARAVRFLFKRYNGEK